jgi:hypothetical protein
MFRNLATTRLYSLWVRCLLLLVAVAVAWPTAAAAAPAADLVIVWAPSTNIAPIAAIAREAGAALIDRSPAPPAPAAIPGMLAKGIEGWDQLRYADAWKALEQARDAVDRTGAEGMSTAQLSDLFLYRGMVRGEQKDPTAFDELVTAMVLDPNRTLDAARFAPTVLEDVERARTAVNSRPRATISIDAPVGCAIAVDGTITDANVPRIAGKHWVRVVCAGHQPWGARIDVSAPNTNVVVRPIPLVAPSDADLLIQARTAGASAVLVVEVRGDVASARVLGADGRERDRRTVVVRTGLGPLIEVVREMLKPPIKPRWYKSRWVWAGGAALIAAGLAIPLTIAATRDNTPTSGTVRIPAGDFWK